VRSERNNSRTYPKWFFALGILLLSFPAWSQDMNQPVTQGIMSPPANVRPPGLEHVGIEQRLNQQVPLNLAFRDETGKAVHLSDYFGQKPVILNLVYYKCPMLCSEVMSGLTRSLKVIKFDAGNQFNVLSVSFNPSETPELAAAAKAQYMQRYGRPQDADGWHFLTGAQESIAALTQAVGFQYQYDPKTDQFAHATAIMVLTPEGRVAQYYYGVEYSPKDLRLGLIQASNHKIGNLVDEVFLYCYHYDPSTGKYGAIISRVLKLSGLATILFLGGMVLILFRRGSQHHDEKPHGSHRYV
jgi:protein SCO1/2